MDTCQFSKNLRSIRQRMNLSKAEFSRRTGISENTINKWESNRLSKLPDLNRLLWIAYSLKIGLQELIGEDAFRITLSMWADEEDDPEVIAHIAKGEWELVNENSLPDPPAGWWNRILGV